MCLLCQKPICVDLSRQTPALSQNTTVASEARFCSSLPSSAYTLKLVLLKLVGVFWACSDPLPCPWLVAPTSFSARHEGEGNLSEICIAFAAMRKPGGGLFSVRRRAPMMHCRERLQTGAGRVGRPRRETLTYSTLILPTTQDGVPQDTRAQEQGSGGQGYRTEPNGRTTARGKRGGPLHLHFLFHHHRLLLRHSGRHEDEHGDQGHHGQVK